MNELEQIRETRRRINRLRETLEEIETEIGTPAVTTYDRIRVQTTPTNRLEVGVVKIEMIRRSINYLQAEIDAKWAVFEAFQQRTGVFTATEMKVAKCRYFEGLNAFETRGRTGLTDRQIRRTVQHLKEKVNKLLTEGRPVC